MSDDENETKQMRTALCAIANEMQKFHCNMNMLPPNEERQIEEIQNDEHMSNALVKCKGILKLKKSQITMLKHKLKIACTLAKTMSAAKETESASLNNLLNYTKNQYWNLEKEHSEKLNVINTLQAENQILRDKLECYHNLIQIGYKSLLDIRHETIDDVPILKKLEKIIVCCGQYNTDSSNQREKCNQLEQKNRFLRNKLRILECENISMGEPRRFCDKSITLRKNGVALSKSQKCTNIGVVCSEYQINRNNSITNLTMSRIEPQRHLIIADDNMNNNFDLTCHLDTVKKLLNDQDTMLQSLKSLSEEIKLKYTETSEG